MKVWNSCSIVKLQRGLSALGLCCHCKGSLSSHSPSSIFSPFLQLVAELLAGMFLAVVCWVTPTSELKELCHGGFTERLTFVCSQISVGWAGALVVLCPLTVKLGVFYPLLFLRACTNGFLVCLQINSTVLKEDLKRMVENFYAALFGYDEVRRLFSGNVQIDHLIPEHRVVQMSKTFTVHFFEEILR